MTENDTGSSGDPSPGVYGSRLLPQHQELLRASAISTEVARSRGYVSVTEKSRLEAVGFSPVQRQVPGLLIPVRGVTGEVVGHELRPDTPRVTDAGKVLKYEKPTGSSNRLDVPPAVAPVLGDPSVVLWFTEGARKVDAAVTAGLACVGVPGVWGWRCTNGNGGKVALPDFYDVALNDREVIICFDSDVTTKPEVRKAIEAFRQFVFSRGASARVCLLPGDDGKVGLDDFLANGGTVDELLARHVTEEMPKSPRVSTTAKTAATVQPPPAEPPALARNPQLLNDFRRRIRARGVVGEETTACILYLLLTTRLLDRQVSAVVKGTSSSGKSFTTEEVVKFFPGHAVIEMTAMSERALVYMEEEFAHRTLILYEAVALREGNEDNFTAYFVRSLLSEGRIKYPVTIRGDDGSFKTTTVVREGPTNLIVTTTKTRVHEENETRLLSLSTDDSRDQTKRVLAELAVEYGRDVDVTEWQTFQHWLEGAEHRVTIPFAEQLAELIPPVAVRLRRDFGAVLALIRAHAVLHQLSRHRDDAGRVIATIEDYAAVRDLVADVLAEGVGSSVPNTIRETVGVVERLGEAYEQGVPASAVAKALDLDKSAAWRRLKAASDRDYIENLEDRRGRPGRWVIGDSLPEDVPILPNPEALQPDNLGATTDSLETQGGTGSGCTVADVSEAVPTPSTSAPLHPFQASADAEKCSLCSRGPEAHYTTQPSLGDDDQDFEVF
jgi:Domain of unknown function (DUF3854)